MCIVVLLVASRPTNILNSYNRTNTTYTKDKKTF